MKKKIKKRPVKTRRSARRAAPVTHAYSGREDLTRAEAAEREIIRLRSVIDQHEAEAEARHRARSLAAVQDAEWRVRQATSIAEPAKLEAANALREVANLVRAVAPIADACNVLRSRMGRTK